jgi:hypothetical protein
MALSAAALALPPEEAAPSFGARTVLGGTPSEERRRELMVRRLADLLFLPAGQVSPHEKGLVDEILSRLYPALERVSRVRLAKRTHNLAEPPRRLLRLMAADEAEISVPFLERPGLFEDGELAALVRATGPAHHMVIAHRTSIGAQTAAALIDTGEGAVIAALISNPGASFGAALMRRVAVLARTNRVFAARLLARADLPAALAHEMFWWVDADARQNILHRFSMERRLLGEAVSDLALGDAVPGDLDWAFRLTGAGRTPPRIESDELALLMRWLNGVEEAGALEVVAEALLIAPATVQRIAQDPGGEPMAVLLKAIGLTLSQFKTLVPLLEVRAGTNTDFTALFGSLSTDWADLVLRLWDLQAQEGEADAGA